MKLFGLDVSTKYIFFELNHKKYAVQFRYSLWKGIYDITVLCNGTETAAEVTIVYPPLRKWLPDIWRIWFPAWLKRQIIEYKRLMRAVQERCSFLKKRKGEKKKENE